MLSLITDLIGILFLSERDFIFSSNLVEAGLVTLGLSSFFIADLPLRWLIVSGLQIVSFLICTPWIGNHNFPILLICLSGFAIALYSYKDKVRAALAFEKWQSQFFCIFILLYALAVFAKLNHGFFNMDETCALFVNRSLLRKINLLDLSKYFSPYFLIAMTLFCEGFLPILILKNQYRKWAILTLLSFHIALSLHYFEFLPLVLIGLLPLLPPSERSTLKVIWEVFFAKYKYAIIALALTYHSQKFYFGANSALLFCFATTGFALALLLSWPILKMIWSLTTRSLVPKININLLGGLFIILMLLIGFGPFLGFRSIGSFAMYSNLDNTGGGNHFLHSPLKLFNEGDELIFLNSKIRPTLKVIMPLWVLPRTKSSYGVPKFELGRILTRASNEQRDLIAQNILDQKIEAASFIAEYEESPLIKKLFFGYRPIVENDMNTCLW